jgi:hypothetical protein
VDDVRTKKTRFGVASIRSMAEDGRGIIPTVPSGLPSETKSFLPVGSDITKNRRSEVATRWVIPWPCTVSTRFVPARVPSVRQSSVNPAGPGSGK